MATDPLADAGPTRQRLVSGWSASTRSPTTSTTSTIYGSVTTPSPGRSAPWYRRSEPRSRLRTRPIHESLICAANYRDPEYGYGTGNTEVQTESRRGPRLHLLEADTMVPMPKIDAAAVAAALADRDQLVAFAAMVLSCDPAVFEARMGYAAHGAGISYITASGAAKATGMPIATATRALLGLESAGLARCNSEGDAWRPDITALDTLALPT